MHPKRHRMRSYRISVCLHNFITSCPLAATWATALLRLGEILKIVILQFTLYSWSLCIPELGPGNKRHVADPKEVGRKIIQNILFTAFEQLLADFGLVVLSRCEAGWTTGIAEDLWFG